MEQEEKDLLLKDLCSRLPYGVKVEYNNCACEVLSIYKDNEELIIWKSFGYKPDIKLESVKPYLFPLSSMTEEQEEEFKALFYKCHKSVFIFNERFSYDRCSIKDIGFYPSYLQDWLNKNHFDYRGLIEKGLAIDCTNLNIY